MDTLIRFKILLTAIITSIFVVVSYEIKNSIFVTQNIPTSLVIIVSFLIGAYFSNFVINFVLNIKWIRKLAFGRSWVEGYWLQKTYDENRDNELNLVATGIVFITYDLNEYSLEVTVFHLKGATVSQSTHSHSVYSSMSSKTMSYINHFLVERGVHQIGGLSAGKFFHDGSTKHPNKYEGRLVYFNGEGTRYQKLNRLNKSEIDKYIRENKENWMEKYLMENSND